MKRLIALLPLAAAALWARSAETVYFRAVLLPGNEVPAVDIQASGAATLRAHVVRDDAGQIEGGSVDFLVTYAFPGPVTLVGLHVHPGATGVNGPVAINSGLTAANPVNDPTGRGTLEFQGQVRPTDQAALAALRGMLENPGAYYVNLHTSEFPAGAIRGQLARAETAVFLATMSPLNEVPAISELDAAGAGSVTVITTRDAAGAPTSAQMLFDVNYRFPGQVTFTGFHIHGGRAGLNGGVIFNTGIGSGPASVASEASGAGRLRRPVEVNLGRAVERDALAGLLADPRNYYLNLHTTEYPGGAIRSQLRATDTMTFRVTMLPSNEVPALALDASAPAVVRVHTARAEDGNVVGGVVDFDVNFRFPGEATFTGLHIHDGAGGVNGPVTVNSGLTSAAPIRSDTGFGNIHRLAHVSEGAGLVTLNSLVRHPENHYVNLHTTVNPGGAVRAQLAPANTLPPQLAAVVAGTLDRNATTLAPGGLVSIFGTNLAKVRTDLSGWEGSVLPEMLNGVAVAVGGRRARLLYVSPTQVNAVLAFETPPGVQLLSVNNGNAPSAPVPVTVAAEAPALFFDNGIALAVRNADSSVVGPDNPARAGEVILLYATGLGATTPALATGALAPATPPAATVPVAVTIGGRDAEVLHSVASPGLAGVYQLAVRVPSGLAPGNAQLVLRAGQAAAPGVILPVQ